MRKILTAQIREELYYSLTSPDEQTMQQRIQKCSRVTLHRSTNPKWKEKQTKKSSYGLDRQQKSIWYGSAKLDNKLFQNAQNITRSYKVHRKNHEKLESWNNSRKKKPGRNKDPKKYFPARCTVTPTIYNWNDSTKPHTQKIYSRIQT